LSQNSGLVPNQWPRGNACIGRNTALAIDNSGDAVHRHADLPRQLSGGNADFTKFLGEMFAGMDRGARHSAS
jgi:hypothetical protein